MSAETGGEMSVGEIVREGNMSMGNVLHPAVMSLFMYMQRRLQTLTQYINQPTFCRLLLYYLLSPHILIGLSLLVLSADSLRQTTTDRPNHQHHGSHSPETVVTARHVGLS